MHSLRRWIPLSIFAIGISVAAIAAAAPYDIPTVDAISASQASITLRVTAGPSGAPGGFTIQYVTGADYDYYGWDQSYVYTCSCWGTPIWNFDSSKEATYVLTPGGSQIAEMGDTFDEMGLTANNTDELMAGTEYYFRVRANGDANGEASDWSSPIEFDTKASTNDDCVFTIGYWKNHPEAWQVGSLMLGTVNYNAADLLSILNTPSGGNGLTILAHQLIAAKLNIAQGANPAPVAATILAADAMIGSLIVPPITGFGFLPPATTSGLATILDNYNNGFTSVPHCGDTATRSSSWGRVKTLYR